ncbi:UvrD-helicase domain-containing protein [Actinopolymorpha sp. B9G3]|uniref:UvrD-helicase domain-containing protein n=1 Tax=Actinopolymorpha sp. B9G3 TaxID=3158970 RepID=UPI0032D9AC64
MTKTLALDPDQERAASACPEARQIVMAGPGAGKSEVVGDRCRRLLDKDVYPEEILVISFSNAAVDVVRARTKNVVDKGRGVDCVTIDSLAARLQADLDDSDRAFTGYDDSIVRATRLLEGANEPVLPEVRHVIVDEVQDVVGVRAQFVLTLLGHAFDEGFGFTLLGDPMQSLYDFQLDELGAWTSETLLKRVREGYGAETVVLKGEYRSRTPDARAVALARGSLDRLAPSDQLLRLRRLSAGVPPLGELDEDAADDLRAWRGTTALLCDTNARAGLVGARLSGLGVPVELAATTTYPSLAPWIAGLLADQDSRVVDFDEFMDLAERAQLEEAEDKWRNLVRVARSRRGLDLRELSSGLRSRRFPASLLRTPGTQTISSTVHRAKGLEFENVVLVDPESWVEDAGDVGVSARRLFVAMSRARSRLTRTRGISTKFWRKDARDGVWLRKSPNGRGTLGLLLEPAFARDLGPAPRDLSRAVGSSVTWSRTDDLVTADAYEVPSWVAAAGGHVVARTGENFGELIRRLSFGGAVPRLIGGRLEGLETLVGSPVQNGPGQHGLWIGAMVSGPLSFEWESPR